MVTFHYHVSLLDGIFSSFHVFHLHPCEWHAASVAQEAQLVAFAQCLAHLSACCPMLGDEEFAPQIVYQTWAHLEVFRRYEFEHHEAYKYWSIIYGSGYNKRRFSEKSCKIIGRDSTSRVNSNPKQQALDPSRWSSFEFNQPWRWGVVCGRVSNVKVRMRDPEINWFFNRNSPFQ